MSFDLFFQVSLRENKAEVKQRDVGNDPGRGGTVTRMWIKLTHWKLIQNLKKGEDKARGILWERDSRSTQYFYIFYYYYHDYYCCYILSIFSLSVFRYFFVLPVIIIIIILSRYYFCAYYYFI